MVVEDKNGVQWGSLDNFEAGAVVVFVSGHYLKPFLHRMTGIAPLYHLIAPSTSSNLTCQRLV